MCIRDRLLNVLEVCSTNSGRNELLLAVLGKYQQWQLELLLKVLRLGVCNYQQWQTELLLNVPGVCNTNNGRRL